MRILLVVPMVPQAEGAGAVPELLHAQLLGLGERHDVTVAGPYGDLAGQPEAAEDLVRSGADVHFVDRRRSPSLPRRWQVRAQLAARWGSGRWPWRAVLAAGGMQPVLDRLFSTRSFDVIAVEDTQMSVLDLPSGTPSVLTEHEAIRPPARDLREDRLADRPVAALRELDSRRWRRFQPSAWRRSALVQVYSRRDAEAIGERAPEVAERVRVNPFGLVLPGAADPALERPGTLLFTGTFTHPPNRDAAFWLAREILPRVSADRPEARLRIVGKGMQPDIRALAGEAVEIVPEAPTVRPHMEAASIVLAPVRTGGGMRMKVLQGMAAGKPVVTTSLGGEGFDVLDPSPPLVVAESTEAVAASIADLLGDADRRLELGRRARETAVRHHSPDAWARRLEAVYEEARAGEYPPVDRKGSRPAPRR